MNKFPLSATDAADAARTVSSALADWPILERTMRETLESRFVGATCIDDMTRIIGEVHAEVRATLPDDEDA